MISPVTPSGNIIPRSSLLPPHQDCGHSETVQRQPARIAEQSGSRPSPGRMVSEPYLHKGQVNISLAAFREAGDGCSFCPRKPAQIPHLTVGMEIMTAGYSFCI